MPRDYSVKVFRGNTPPLKVVAQEEQPLGDRRLIAIKDIIKIKKVMTFRQISQYTNIEESSLMSYMQMLEKEQIVKRGKVKNAIGWKFLDQ